jgi:hypothetical protein
MKECKCGCGIVVKGSRVFVNKEHQLRWLASGGGAELNALLPKEVRVRGGQTAGASALKSGRLAEASQKGVAKVRSISKQHQATQESQSIALNCSGVCFHSQLDERHMFLWASEISGFVRWEQDTMIIQSKLISEESLRDLLALFWRYQIPMQQLAQFESNRNSAWFRAPHMYWHERVFSSIE